jgi:ATP-dependent Clp protease ATP-binding subunit ClpA
MDSNRLTQKWQEALHDAQTKARRFGHVEVGGEHLLLALALTATFAYTVERRAGRVRRVTCATFLALPGGRASRHIRPPV